MRAKTENLSDQWVRGWCDIAMPYELVNNHGPDTWYRFPPEGWFGARGINVGTHSGLIHVYGTWAPGQVVESDILRWPHPVGHQFWATDWVWDPADPGSLDDLLIIPMHQLEQDGEIVEGTDFFDIKMIENTAVRQVWHGLGRVKGTMMVLEVWLYIYSGQDKVYVEGTFTNSDPRVPELRQAWQHLALKSGEFFAIDFRTKFGMPVPVQDKDGKWVQIISGPRSLDDSQQIDFSGWLLCLPSDHTTVNLLDYETSARLNTMLAQVEFPGFKRGPVVGQSLDWDGHWQAFGPVPKFPVRPEPYMPITPESMRAEFDAYLNNVGDIYDVRPGSSTKSPSDTGGQEDFGACRGEEVVTVEETGLLRRIQIGVSSYMRGFHNREVSGEPVRAKDHPKLVTWSQRPFGRLNPNADSLGKGFHPSGYAWDLFGTGHSPFDDQHRSQNTFNADLALRGTYKGKKMLKDFLQMDLAQVPDRMGAPRAQGRLFMAWAAMLRLLDDVTDKTALEIHMQDRLKFVLENWPGGQFLSNPDTPIRVLDWTRGTPELPDIPAWVVWQHSIACMGYYAAWLATKDERYFDFAFWMAELVTRYGCFHDGFSWRCCTAVQYLLEDEEGYALPPLAYTPISKQINVDDGWWTWTYPAVKICYYANEHMGAAKSESLKARAASIMQQIEEKPPENWQQSRWWAVV